jgi:MFS family permease
MTEVRSGDLIAALDEASLSRFHLRAVLVSGMGFFTDAYDLSVIGIASTLVAKEWDLSSGRLALLNSVMRAAAFLGAFVFGRCADVAGRKRVYWMVAAIMIVGALGSAHLGAGISGPADRCGQSPGRGHRRGGWRPVQTPRSG